MAKPQNLKTKIFLDSGDPGQTKEILDLLGFLDGQTTNPTLIAKNTDAAKRLAEGKKFTKKEIYDFYKKVVSEVSALIPVGSVSVEVYADKNTTASQMLSEAREMFSWISNAHIKFPTTKEGLAAAEQAVKEGMRVNMTLCFTQEQAAAVYCATKGAKKGLPTASAAQAGQVFVSPFIGRLDDLGQNGMQLIENILKMYKGGLPAATNAAQAGDGHVEVLTASVRNMNHFLRALQLESDIITTPFAVLKEWVQKGMTLPGNDFTYNTGNLTPIEYQDLDLEKPWQEFNISHELTEKGIQRFSDDWNSLIG